MDKKELMNYLKDAYELEKQLYTLNQLKEEYEDAYEILEDELKQPLCVEERFDGTANPNCRTSVTIDWTTSDEFYEKKNNYPYNKYKDYRDYLVNEKSIQNMRNSWKTVEYDKLIKDEEKEDKIIGIKEKLILLALVLDVIIVITNFSIPLLIIGIIVFIFLIKVNPGINTARKEKVSYLKKCYENDLNSKDIWYQERMDIISTEYKEIIIENILQTEKLLEKLYATNFIHPKYRNLIAVGQIYEYLETNRCNELEGPNGAYNLFESELRQNIIILELDEIIDQLEQLNRAMYYVTAAINESNRLLGNISNQLGQISTSLSQIQGNSALTAYNSQVTAFNVELMRRYN